jgi:ferredoxin-NADP reductase
VARAAVLGRLTWLVADVLDMRRETASASTLVLDVPGWSGHLAGQHVDVRLTAEDGYTAQRSYSIANAARDARVELTVQRVPDGEVSTYLVDEARPGDQIELRGPVGGYFVWRPEQAEPVLLLAGGSGLVPLMSIVRARAAAGSVAPMRLVYSVRGEADVLYAAELQRRGADSAGPDAGLDVVVVYTRSVPPGWVRPPGRIDAALLAEISWPPEREPTIFVCGPTAFVEAMADLLVGAGHPPTRVRTERFG